VCDILAEFYNVSIPWGLGELNMPEEMGTWVAIFVAILSLIVAIMSLSRNYQALKLTSQAFELNSQALELSGLVFYYQAYFALYDPKSTPSLLTWGVFKRAADYIKKSKRALTLKRQSPSESMCSKEKDHQQYIELEIIHPRLMQLAEICNYTVGCKHLGAGPLLFTLGSEIINVREYEDAISYVLKNLDFFDRGNDSWSDVRIEENLGNLLYNPKLCLKR